MVYFMFYDIFYLQIVNQYLTRILARPIGTALCAKFFYFESFSGLLRHVGAEKGYEIYRTWHHTKEDSKFQVYHGFLILILRNKNLTPLLFSFE